MPKSIISVDVYFNFNGLSANLSIVEHKDFIIFLVNAVRNHSLIDCFRVTFGSEEFCYGSSVTELSKFLEYQWFEEVETCDDAEDE